MSVASKRGLSMASRLQLCVCLAPIFQTCALKAKARKPWLEILREIWRVWEHLLTLLNSPVL